MNGSKRGSDDELANSYVKGPLATGNLFIEVNSIGTVRTSERDDFKDRQRSRFTMPHPPVLQKSHSLPDGNTLPMYRFSKPER
jgi:hypothetical protein